MKRKKGFNDGGGGGFDYIWCASEPWENGGGGGEVLGFVVVGVFIINLLLFLILFLFCNSLLLLPDFVRLV